MARLTGGRHHLGGALLILTLAVWLFFSSERTYKSRKSLHLTIRRDTSYQSDTVDAGDAVSLQESESRTPGFNASSEDFDHIYEKISSQRTYSKREDSRQKAAYDKALCKGDQLLQIANDNLRPGLSPYNDFKQLEDNGWTNMEYNSQLLQSYGPACNALGISAKKEDNDPTGAEYANFINVHGRAIFRQSNYGPEYQLRRYPEDYRVRLLPELRRWSDVMWLTWEKHAGNKAGDLEYIFHDTMINEDTQLTIDHVADLNKNQNLKGYPGIELAFDSESGKAVLGTANALGVAWFLHDHRDKIKKKLDTVRVWTQGSPSPSYHMLLKLKDP